MKWGMELGMVKNHTGEVREDRVRHQEVKSFKKLES